MQNTRKLATLISITGLLFASSVWADNNIETEDSAVSTRENHFIFSATGPGEGNTNIGLGGRVFLILPTFDFTYNRGISDALTFEVNAFTLGVFNSIETGIRYRLLGDESFSLAVRGDVRLDGAFIAVGGVGGAGAVALGVTPGLIASFGGPKAQLSLGVDVPTNFIALAAGGGGAGAAVGVAPSVRPSVTVEFPVSEKTNLYIQGQALIDTTLGIAVPVFAVGSAF